jgi:uncharacterized damage-inducible protein DinB
MTVTSFPIDKSMVQLLFSHHLWSNLRLFDACLTLNGTQLNHTDPGTYGSINTTLRHLIRAEERYLFFLTGRAFKSTEKTDAEPTIADLKERARRSGTALQEVAANLQPGAKVLVDYEEDGEQIPAIVIMLQAIHHAHEHRAQVATLLGQQGIEPPRLSGWGYYDQVMATE